MRRRRRGSARCTPWTIPTGHPLTRTQAQHAVQVIAWRLLLGELVTVVPLDSPCSAGPREAATTADIDLAHRNTAMLDWPAVPAGEHRVGSPQELEIAIGGPARPGTAGVLPRRPPSFGPGRLAAAGPDLSGLPPALVLTGERDTLRADGVRYARRLREAGVPVWHDDTPGVDHYFLTEDPALARTTVAEVALRVAAAHRAGPG